MKINGASCTGETPVPPISLLCDLSASAVKLAPSMRRTPFADAHTRLLAGRMGLWLFLASLGMLFGATLIAFLVLRIEIGRSGGWPEMPPLPRVLWPSTIVIVISSGSVQLALASVRRGSALGLKIGMILTLGLGAAFLSLQSLAWLEWIAPVTERWHESDEWRFALTCFYIFTGLHAAHVLGGLIPMSLVTLRAVRHRYSPEHHLGVQLCAMYWHFLAVVWLALLAVMLIGV
jgi:cytochrome c oxidase subunit 3